MRALLLDFDGLICDTERAARQSWEELYQMHGLTFPPQLWAEMMGCEQGEIRAVTDLSARLDRPVDAAMRAYRLARKVALCQQEPLRPGVAALLAAARRRDLTLAVVSSSARDWVEGHLVRLGIRERFDAVVTGDEVNRPKPAPDLYHLALMRTGMRAEEALAFEDSPTGVRAARSARIRCVAVPGSVGDHNNLGAADLVVPSLAAYRIDASAARWMEE